MISISQDTSSSRRSAVCPIRALSTREREIAPSTSLRKWFGHDPARWAEFRRKYRAELDNNFTEVQRLRDALGRGTATLLYGSKDEAHNQAVVLAEYLSGKTE